MDNKTTECHKECVPSKSPQLFEKKGKKLCATKKIFREILKHASKEMVCIKTELLSLKQTKAVQD